MLFSTVLVSMFVGHNIVRDVGSGFIAYVGVLTKSSY